MLHLAADQSISLLSIEADAWADHDSMSELGDGRIMSVFEYESSWTWWERHPIGAELVLALSGAAVFHLGGDSAERTASLAEGKCLLIPEGAWHRAEITTRTTMLFVTPSPALTEHRDA